MDFLSVTKYLMLSVVYDLKAYVKTFQKNCIILVWLLWYQQGLLVAKHRNECNYKTKHRMFTILG